MVPVVTAVYSIRPTFRTDSYVGLTIFQNRCHDFSYVYSSRSKTADSFRVTEREDGCNYFQMPLVMSEVHAMLIAT